MADDQIFTKEQFHAARVMIAQLRCEANHENFDQKSLGIKISEETSNAVLMRLEDGTEVTVQQTLQAYLTMVWSLLVEQAVRWGEDSALPGVGRLGLGLAKHEPNS